MNISYLVQDLIGHESKQYRDYKDAMMHVGKLWEKHFYSKLAIYYAYLLTLENGEVIDIQKFHVYSSKII